ncbi:MAG TPA: hypothetical protein VGC35_00300 [Allosphingosinicella sp.]|jgi:lysozyme family protein
MDNGPATEDDPNPKTASEPHTATAAGFEGRQTLGDDGGATLSEAGRAKSVGHSAGEMAESPHNLQQIEAALNALSKSGSNLRDASLLLRLIELRDRAEALLSGYSTATRARAHFEGTLDAAPPSFEELKPEYERLFATCTVRPSHAGEVAWYSKMILRGRTRYEEASARTSVPWWFIGIIHGMEASFNFASHLHNGDPLDKRTVQVPKGRPPIWNPPTDWLSSAADALEYEGFTGQTDWSVARALYRWETYNGFGYRKSGIGIPSPYLWSFSNHYSKGKYVADGKYDPNAISRQCGTAVMLKALQNTGGIPI